MARTQAVSLYIGVINYLIGTGEQRYLLLIRMPSRRSKVSDIGTLLLFSPYGIIATISNGIIALDNNPATKKGLTNSAACGMI